MVGRRETRRHRECWIVPNAKELVAFITGDSDYQSNLGQPEKEIKGVNSIEKARSDQLAFLSKKNNSVMADSEAGLLLAPIESVKIATRARNVLFVKSPKFEFSRAAWRYFPPGPPKITIGRNCTIHGSAVIGLEGFGYANGLKFPHYAGVVIEDDVDVWAQSVIQRGTFEDTHIGQGTKIDSLVHVGHGVKVGKHCIITAGTIIGGSSRIGDDCWLGINCTIRNHIEIGNNVIVGMGAVVINDIPDNETVAGVPARPLAK